MKKTSSFGEYLFAIVLISFMGLVFVFVLTPTLWELINKEEKIAVKVDGIQEFRFERSESQKGKFKQDIFEYSILFSDGSLWGTKFYWATFDGKPIPGSKEEPSQKIFPPSIVKLHELGLLDTTIISKPVSILRRSSDIQHLSSQPILMIKEGDKWKLLKIGEEYLVGEPFTSFQIFLLYMFTGFVLLIGLFSLTSAIYSSYQLYIDTNGFQETDNLPHIINRYDGLVYILNGFKTPEWLKEEGDSEFNKEQN